MIVDVILNALLIPQLASSGAAIGTLAAETGMDYSVLCFEKGCLWKHIERLNIVQLLLGWLLRKERKK